MTPTPRPADTHDVIRVIGARENTLRDVDVTIPKRRLTVFTGVSGSGKSSLVFDTIAAESRRMIDETYSSFVQGFMPPRPRPEVDRLEGLTPAVIVGQDRLGANPRSTVGTVTDVGAMLRMLFARIATPSLGSPRAYSFNVASASGSGSLKKADGTRVVREFSVTGGMCPRCEGRGSVSDVDLTELFDADKSLNGGALRVPGMSMDGWYGRIFAGSKLFDMDKPLGRYGKREMDNLLHKGATRITVDGVNLTYEGLLPRIRRSMLSKDVETLQPHVRAFVERAVVFRTCPDCDGTRLTEGARTSRIGRWSIADVCSWQITDVAAWLRDLHDPRVAPLLTSLLDAVEAFDAIGLGYLTLDRAAGTLSGGESQRVKMIRHLGSALTDVTYVFDEPSVGLHPRDVERLSTLLLALRDKGNTVLVVEHDPEIIRLADHVVELGPGAGSEGGRVTFSGTLAQLRASGTLTGRELERRVRPRSTLRTPTGVLELRDVRAHNLGGVDVDVPLGVLTVITGVAGSGKSSLVAAGLEPREDVVVVGQDPSRGSRRSNPATYTGMFDSIRKAFAKACGVKPALFSANSAGACPECKGSGIVDLGGPGGLDAVEAPCENCEGRRYAPEVLEHRLGEASITDVLDMSVRRALEFFTDEATSVPAAVAILRRLEEVGLGYLTLGQPLTTLSGGERQRLELATHLGSRRGILVLDEPTSGLHLADVEALLQLLDRLVDGGRTVVVVEHHEAVVAHADHVIDLGPGAGQDGGRVVFTGPPSELASSGRTPTGEYLARHLGRGVAENENA